MVPRRTRPQLCFSLFTRPAHILIDKAIPDSRWFIFSALAAAGAAIATSILAFITRNLAKATTTMAEKTAELAAQTATQVRESAEAIAQTERHHQESLMPLVSILGGFRIESGDNTNWFRFAGELVNDGPGPAVSILLFAYNTSVLVINTPQPEITGRSQLAGFIKGRHRDNFSCKWAIREGPPWYVEQSVPSDSAVLFKTIFGTEGMVAQFTPANGEPKTRKVIVPSRDSSNEIREYFSAKGYGDVPDY